MTLDTPRTRLDISPHHDEARSKVAHQRSARPDFCTAGMNGIRAESGSHAKSAIEFDRHGGKLAVGY
jgi:hypothetical protein